MILEIFEKIFAELKSNKDITKYCEDTFGKKQTVYKGQNLENPVPKDKSPAIVVAGLKDARRNDLICFYPIIIGVMVSNDAIVENENGIEYTGFVQSLELSELVREALLKLNFKLTIESDATIPCEVFPLFAEQMIVLIEKPKNVRR